jgi:hypothetical protein
VYNFELLSSYKSRIPLSTATTFDCGNENETKMTSAVWCVCCVAHVHQHYANYDWKIIQHCSLAVISMTDWLIEQSIFDLTERSNKHKHKHKHKEIEKIWFDIFIPTKQTTILRLSKVSWLLQVFVHSKVTCELIFIWFYTIDIVVMSQWFTIQTLAKHSERCLLFSQLLFQETHIYKRFGTFWSRLRFFWRTRI